MITKISSIFHVVFFPKTEQTCTVLHHDFNVTVMKSIDFIIVFENQDDEIDGFHHDQK